MGCVITMTVIPLSSRHIDTGIVPVRSSDRTARYRYCINSESLSYRTVSYCNYHRVERVTTRGNYTNYAHASIQVCFLSRARVSARLPQSPSHM